MEPFYIGLLEAFRNQSKFDVLVKEEMFNKDLELHDLIIGHLIEISGKLSDEKSHDYTMVYNALTEENEIYGINK